MLNKKNLQKPFWAITPKKSLELLETTESGLSSEEAAERIKTFGKNIIPSGKRANKATIFFDQFRSPLILILIAAGIITLLLKSQTDSAFIFAAVIINALLGFYQENKAETALESLKTYIKERARVIRDGEQIEINAEEIIPGDIIRLTAGSRIPADARLITANELSIDEAILTGESQPTHKTVGPVKENCVVSDKKCMVFGGTFVNYGVGTATVTATGGHTEIGKIASMVGKSEERTPLQESISRFAIQATIVLAIFTGFLFAIGVYRGQDLLEMFVTSVAVAVSAVPEGLPISLTVILAIGVERLARKKGVIKRLLAAETLGRTTTIITDKTGTLTEAKMELTDIITFQNHHTKENILEQALSCINVIIENPESPPKEWRILGRPLETAIARAAAEHKVFLNDVKSKVEVLDSHPFNSKDKFSATSIQKDSKKSWIFLGAPEALIDKVKARVAMKKNIVSRTDSHARKGMRVLGIATEKNFLGLLIFKDPVRPKVKKVIAKVKKAGIKTVIATGDHKGTALSVAREVGLSAEEKETLTGEELQKLTDSELAKRVGSIKIFSRVTPADKVRIAAAFKSRGEVVAMTGDGVNDAPALKETDIGIAVGSGTDVAKGAADLVILDNNFETIVAAINEGRRILRNIKKVIIYLLSDSFDELFLIGGALLLGIPLPLNALQILWVNFFSDSFPAIAFAFENGSDHLKELPPKKRPGLFDRDMKLFILVIGTISSALLFTMYLALLKLGLDEQIVRTFTFASFALYTLFLSFSLRRLHTSILKYNPFTNRYLNGGVIIGVILTLAAIYLPILQGVLKTTALSIPWLIGVVAFCLLNIAAIELGKFLLRR